MTIWDAFHARHGRKNFTPAFNDHLEALIADDNADLSDRLRALILRRAWGNHSDCCVNDEGVVMGQADCARELNVTRQQANPFFQSLARGNYVRMKGREIHPVDNPFEGEAGFANSSPNVEPFRTDSEDEANIDGDEPTESAEGVSFEDFIEQVWSREDPIGYQSYQEVAKSFKAWRIKLLAKYKAYERGAKVGEAQCPKGSDNASERVGQCVRKGRTTPDPILITENKKTENTPLPLTQAPRERPEEARNANPWRGLLLAAEKAWLNYAEGELPQIRRYWQDLSRDERHAAISGISARLEVGEYADPHFVPTLLNYIRKKLWTARLRPPAKRKGPDTAWLESQLEPEAANGAGNGS